MAERTEKFVEAIIKPIWERDGKQRRTAFSGLTELQTLRKTTEEEQRDQRSRRVKGIRRAMVEQLSLEDTSTA